MRKHVYCESKFLETCISKINNWKFTPENFEELQLWMCVKAMIFSRNIILHLDITADDLPKFDCVRPSKQFADWQKEIAAKRNTSEIHLRLGNFVTLQNIDKSDDTQLTAYYLTCCDSATCRNCMNECGVLAICPDNITDFKDILYDNGSAIKKNEQISWQRKLFFSPCNSLVLVDNYILSDTRGIDNLKNIFDVLLPHSLSNEVPFQISIFTTLRSGNQRTDIDSNKRFAEIAQMVEVLRPDLLFRMAIFKCSFEQFHDRIIITNNTYISCGGGFDLINRGTSSKTTTLSIVFPFLCKSAKWDSMAYSNFWDNVKDNYERAQEFRADYLTGFYIGDKRNRLMSQTN